MATFLELQNAVLANLIDAPTAVANAVPELVNKAVRGLQQRRSFKVMETETTLTTVVGVRSLGTMPADFKEWRYYDEPFRRAQSGATEPVELLASRDDALRRFSFNDPTDKGPPEGITWVASGVNNDQALEVWPFPDGLSDWTTTPAGEYRIVLPYYRYLPDLVASGDTNWFTTRAVEWIEYYATGLGFLKDWDEQRAAQWFAVASGKLPEVMSLDKALLVSPVTVLAVRSDVRAARNQRRL